MNSPDTNTKNNAIASDDSRADEKQSPPCQLIIHTQYIKDFSFENPNVPKSLVEDMGKPDVEINVSVSANLFVDKQYEVLLNLGAKAMAGNTTMFLIELAYAGLVSPQGEEDDETNALIMIEAPRLLFPFARAIIANATRDGGFIPLNIQPVDFVAIYNHSLAQKVAIQ
jgi:preprotein translocase subunit SecB